MAFISSIGLRLLCLALLYFATKKVIASLQYWRLTKHHNCSRPQQYRHKDPIFGLDLYRKTVASRAKGDYKNTLQNFFRRYGKTFEAHIFGETVIYTSEVENIQAINTSEFENFGVEGIRKQANASWIGEGIFVSDGEVWKYARKVVMPIFARKQVADLKGFGEHLEKMMELVPGDGEMVDLRPLLRRLFLDTSTEFLFAESADTLLPHSSKLDAEKFLASFDRAMLGVDRRMSLRGLSFLWGRATRDREWKEACAETHGVVDKYIERALAEKADSEAKSSPSKDTSETVDSDGSIPGDQKRPISFLHELVKETSDRQFIRDQIISLFFPARDASAIAISDLFFQLARNPGVWTKLRSEVLNHEEPLTFESLKTMKYLQAVLNESLRLLAPASVSRRTCTHTTTLPRGGGPNGSSPILVLPGTHIDSHFGIMQRDTSIWGPDAEVFRPERWIEGILRPGWTYVPFLGGGRICPAQQMVLCQMGFLLARFVGRFKGIVNRDPVEGFVEEYMFSVQSRNGVKVGFFGGEKVQ